MTIDDLKMQLDRIEALLKQSLSEKKTGLLSGADAAVASDFDLDGQWGDPEVRKDSPQWIKNGGASHVGRRFSQCPSDYLDALAAFFEWKAGKDEAEGSPEKLKYAGYARKDAARARGWSKRNKGKPAEPETSLPF